jgi:outer membrane cobalamin receptor
MRLDIVLKTLVILLFASCLAIGQTEVSVVLGDSDSGNEDTPIVWKGRVLLEADDTTIPGVNIVSEEGPTGFTDTEGRFEITLSKAKYKFVFSAIGFKDKIVNLDARSSGFTDIVVTSKDEIIDEVVISGASEQSVITQITPGLERLGIKELDAQSKFFGEIDVLRSLQSMSGVHNAGEGASGFNVRGGNSDQNLILQDGHLIFNPSHALGFFSLFHPDLIQYVDLYKGGIPAKYGGRLSSVLSVETRNGSKDKFKVKGGLGVISSRLTVEGPILKDKLSFIVGGRYSYANWIFNLVDDPTIDNSRALFNDVTAKLNGRLTPTTNVGVSFLRSRDAFQFGEEARFDYSTVSAEAYLKQLIGDNINLTLNYNQGRYTSSLFDLKGNDQSMFTNFIDYQRAKLDLLFAASEKIKINGGAEFNAYDVSPGEVEPFGENSIRALKTLPKEKANELVAYLEGQVEFSEGLQLSAGIRATRFSNIGPGQVFVYPEDASRSFANIIDTLSFDDGETIAQYSGLEPRVSLLYELNSSSSVKVGYARNFQYLAQISNTASATPIDIWQLSNRYVLPQRSDNFSIGYFKNWKENLYESSLEVFYRKSDNIIDYKDFAELLLNEHLETDLVTGIGRAYGVELNLTKKFGSLSGNMSYTYSISERQIESNNIQGSVNNGAWYPSNYNIPHVLNLNLVQNFKNSNLAVNFTYRSGRPTTAPVSSFSNQNVVNIPIYSDRNKFTVPAFHRLDLSYTIGPWGKVDSNFKQSLTISIYNLYLRRNAYSVYFRQNPFESVKAIRVATLGTIFPSITYNFSIN